MEVGNNQKIQKTIDKIKLDLAIDFVGIALSNENPETVKREIRWRYVSGNIGERYKKIVLQVGRGLAGIVWRTGRPLVENHLEEKNPNEILEYPIAIMEELNHVVVVPVTDEENVIAVLLVGYRDKEKVITSDIIEKANSSAIIVSKAIIKERANSNG